MTKKRASSPKCASHIDVTPGFTCGAVEEIDTILRRDDIANRPASLPAGVNDAVTAMSNDTLYIALAGLPELRTLSAESLALLYSFFHYSTSRGVEMALYRYADQVKRVPELATWRQRRKHGGDKGREGSTHRANELAQRIRDKWAAMEAAGENPTNASVAAAIKKECGRGSIRTVQRAFTEPGKKTTPAKRTKR